MLNETSVFVVLSIFPFYFKYTLLCLMYSMCHCSENNAIFPVHPECSSVLIPGSVVEYA